MESNHHIKAGQEATSEAELELLIAQYTLEYLHRWTNNFDAAQLAQIKHLLDNVVEPRIILKQVMGLEFVLPS